MNSNGIVELCVHTTLNVEFGLNDKMSWIKLCFLLNELYCSIIDWSECPVPFTYTMKILIDMFVKCIQFERQILETMIQEDMICVSQCIKSHFKQHLLTGSTCHFLSHPCFLSARLFKYTLILILLIYFNMISQLYKCQTLIKFGKFKLNLRNGNLEISAVGLIQKLPQPNQQLNSAVTFWPYRE